MIIIAKNKTLEIPNSLAKKKNKNNILDISIVVWWFGSVGLRKNGMGVAFCRKASTTPPGRSKEHAAEKSRPALTH